MRLRVATLCTLASLALTASADGTKFGLGLSGGVFMPSSAPIKTALGKNWTSIGIGPSWIGYTVGKHSMWDVDMWGVSSNGNRAFVIMPTYGYQYMTGDPKKKDEVKPFAAAHVGPIYADYRIGANSGRRFGMGGALEIGGVYSDRVRVSARYNMVSKVGGMDFSGLNLTFSWTVTKF